MDKLQLYMICHWHFNEGRSVAEIKDLLHETFQIQLTRNAIYPQLRKAETEGIIRLIPPLRQELSQQIGERYDVNPERVHVVGAEMPASEHAVPAMAAEMVLEHIRTLGRGGKNTVVLGLGPGRATLELCRRLGKMLEAETHVPNLRLVAITAGAPARSPEYASSGFFNLFPHEIATERIGLFAESLVQAGSFDFVKTHVGVREAFEEKDNVDIVVTAMGSFSDRHDLLRRALIDSTGKENVFPSYARTWLGNVQYRPFTADGPVIEEDDQLRAVTLFELEDFVDMATRRDKLVVLMARQCGRCVLDESANITRVDALRPLLRSPKLRVWSELIVDQVTARQLAGI